MKFFREFFRYLSATVLGIALACAVSPAAADIVQNTIYNLGSTVVIASDGASTSYFRWTKDMWFYAQTVDGTDNGTINIAGGGGVASSGRGSYIAIRGNEASNGKLDIVEGANGGGVSITAGTTTITGALTSSKTTDLGWTIVSVANQACNTTCTSACVFGQETTSKAILACTDATADLCLCAGAS